MGTRESYENGVFCWVELATTDVREAGGFYSQLFGWQIQEISVPEQNPYYMAVKDGRSVAGIFAPSQQEIAPGWNSYINVKDIEATVGTWQEKGGRILQTPFPVMESGLMAVVQDPCGAVVSLWQPQQEIGAQLVNEPGTFCWTELQVHDTQKARDFYASVFGWDFEVDAGTPPYIMAKVGEGDRAGCGIFDLTAPGIPPNIPSSWVVYFNVQDLDASLRKLQELGGKVLLEVIEADVGPLTMVSDPQGVAFYLIQLRRADD